MVDGSGGCVKQIVCGYESKTSGYKLCKDWYPFADPHSRCDYMLYVGKWNWTCLANSRPEVPEHASNYPSLFQNLRKTKFFSWADS